MLQSQKRTSARLQNDALAHAAHMPLLPLQPLLQLQQLQALRRIFSAFCSSDCLVAVCEHRDVEPALLVLLARLVWLELPWLGLDLREHGQLVWLELPWLGLDLREHGQLAGLGHVMHHPVGQEAGLWSLFLLSFHPLVFGHEVAWVAVRRCQPQPCFWLPSWGR